MDEKETIQKTIDFIASEIRENRIQLKKLNLELQAAIKKQQELRGVVYNGFRKNYLRFHQITAINFSTKKRSRTYGYLITKKM